MDESKDLKKRFMNRYPSNVIKGAWSSVDRMKRDDLLSRKSCQNEAEGADKSDVCVRLITKFGTQWP